MSGVRRTERGRTVLPSVSPQPERSQGGKAPLARALGAPGPPAAARPRDVVLLQRFVGNRAVGRLLARDADAHEAQQNPKPNEAKPPLYPDWFRANSDQGPLPGDRVAGVPGSGATYTEPDRLTLTVALDERLALNKSRWPDLVSNFTGAVIGLWTDYVTEAMEDASEDDWPWYYSLMSFVVRDALAWLFFEGWALTWATKKLVTSIAEASETEMVEHAAKKLGHAAAFAMEQGSEWIHEHQGSGRVAIRARELKSKAGAVSEVLAGALGPVGLLLADGVIYDRWVKGAPVSQLHLFRIPPEIPDVDEARIKAHVAQALASVVAEWASVEPFAKSHASDPTVVAGFDAKGLGRSTSYFGPQYRGPEAFREAVQGSAVKDLPHMPLYVSFRTPIYDYNYQPPEGQLIDAPVLKDILQRSSIDLSAYIKLENAYNHMSIPEFRPYDPDSIWYHDPHIETTVAKVTRNRDGLVTVDEGNLAAHLCLYEIAHPHEDVGDIVTSAAGHLTRLEMQTEVGDTSADDVVKDLYDRLWDGVVEGAEFLLRNDLGPLKLVG